jgi:ATP-dependent DNA helicase RecG
MSNDDLEKMLEEDEGLNLEFKTASNSFDRDNDLPDYCAALANEGGGKLILGVNNDRKIVGTKAFEKTYNRLPHYLLTALHIRVDVYQLKHPKGRVLVFNISARGVGQVVRSTGKYRYPMRSGESLVEMDQNTLKNILNEVSIDFSSKIVNGLKTEDLDTLAVKTLKKLWSQKANRKDYLRVTDQRMLEDISLKKTNGLTFASLILLGKKEKIAEYLPDAEIIFEWRQEQNKVAFDFRKTWRLPFMNIYDEVWQTINIRNLRIPFQEGFIQREIFAFDEKSIREAILNAVTHRNYEIIGKSIFIKASPSGFTIESPGGLMSGVTIENILFKNAWRNRLLAETFEKAGLVERSGQGIDDIYKKTIEDGKGVPDLSRTDDFSVTLSIPAKVKDPNFILYLEKIVNEKQITLSTEEIYELEKIRASQKIANILHAERFIKLGVVEKVGTRRGTKYILSAQYYASVDKLGSHTRLKGLSREKNKELILAHIKNNKKGYPREFRDAFSDLGSKHVDNLLQELRRENKIHYSKENKSWILIDQD